MINIHYYYYYLRFTGISNVWKPRLFVIISFILLFFLFSVVEIDFCRELAGLDGSTNRRVAIPWSPFFFFSFFGCPIMTSTKSRLIYENNLLNYGVLKKKKKQEKKEPFWTNYGLYNCDDYSTLMLLAIAKTAYIDQCCSPYSLQQATCWNLHTVNNHQLIYYFYWQKTTRKPSD